MARLDPGDEGVDLGDQRGFVGGLVFLGDFLVGRADQLLVNSVAGHAAALGGQVLVGKSRSRSHDAGSNQRGDQNSFHVEFLVV